MSIPLISAKGKSIPEVYEKLLVSVFKEGIDIRTQYDSETDYGSLDVCAAVEVKEPFAEPRIHKCFPGGMEDLEVYRQEVVEGIHDHWVGTKWKYSYHGRLCNYKTYEGHYTQEFYDQIFGVAGLVDKLVNTPFTRRAQGITWVPYVDNGFFDPPCLQRIWARIINGKLQMHTHWRSRDLWKAWFMNVFALTDWQRVIASEISSRMGEKIDVGSYVEMIDSLHVYGKDRTAFVREVNKIMIDPDYTGTRVLTEVSKTSENVDHKIRTLRSDDERVADPFKETREKLERDKDFMLTGTV